MHTPKINCLLSVIFAVKINRSQPMFAEVHMNEIRIHIQRILMCLGEVFLSQISSTFSNWNHQIPKLFILWNKIKFSNYPIYLLSSLDKSIVQISHYKISCNMTRGAKAIFLYPFCPTHLSYTQRTLFICHSRNRSLTEVPKETVFRTKITDIRLG